jgi:hypothetical protein
MTVVAGSWDRNGHPIATHHQVVSIPSTLAPAGDELRYQLMSRLALERGRHDIRVAVEDASDGRLGSVYTTLDIPNFRREPLSLSGLIVGASPSGPLVPDNLFEDLLPIFPTALREFRRTSRVAAFVRAYQGGNGTLVDTTVRATLVGVANRPVVNEVAMLPSARFAHDRSADYLFEIPVARLPPGPYLLTIEAAHTDRRVTRHLRFDVRP